jgi:hypothetical protein
MRTQNNPATVLDRFWQEEQYGHAADVAVLVLERLPSGEHAWLKPSTPADGEARYWITDEGRRVLREAGA